VTQDNHPIKASASASETAAPAYAPDAIFDDKVTTINDDADSIAAHDEQTVSR
jgi:hypothetical protein